LKSQIPAISNDKKLSFTITSLYRVYRELYEMMNFYHMNPPPIKNHLAGGAGDERCVDAVRGIPGKEADGYVERALR
jgi:hypothetical protein